MANKKYGLILPDKANKQLAFKASRNVFGSDNDSDNETEKPVSFSNLKRRDKIAQEKAILEDPTIYQYDEIYDNVKKTINIEKQKNKEDKNSKYINSLLKFAHKRKLENERRIERQVQKEREKEGDEFANKEVFVTSAYKKKLQEMREEEEKEKYEEYLESIGDVTKQTDLGGFYRHLYEQELGKEKEKSNTKETDDNIKKEMIVNEDKNTQKTKTIRNYRKRKCSNDTNLSEGEIVSDDEINRHNLEDIKAKKERRDPNIDADSDFSVNDPSEDEDDKIIEKSNNKIDEKEAQIMNSHKVEKEFPPDIVDKNISPKNSEIESIPKIDIWKKRTVGVVFEEALKRYYERKAARNM